MSDFPKKARSKWRECISQLILYFLELKNILSCKIGKYMWLAFNLLHAKMKDMKMYTKFTSTILFCNKYVICNIFFVRCGNWTIYQSSCVDHWQLCKQMARNYFLTILNLPDTELEENRQKNYNHLKTSNHMFRKEKNAMKICRVVNIFPFPNFTLKFMAGKLNLYCP